MQNKKGQITNNVNVLIFGIILFVVLVVVIVVGANVVTNLSTVVTRSSLTITNETDAVTLVWGNNTNMTLDHAEVNVLAIWNLSADSPIIGAGNYTVFGSVGVINCIANTSNASGPKLPQDGNVVGVNYTYLNENAAWNVSKGGEQGLLTFGDFFSVIAITIVLVVVAGLLLGVILLFRRSRA